MPLHALQVYEYCLIYYIYFPAWLGICLANNQYSLRVEFWIMHALIAQIPVPGMIDKYSLARIHYWLCGFCAEQPGPLIGFIFIGARKCTSEEICVWYMNKRTTGCVYVSVCVLCMMMVRMRRLMAFGQMAQQRRCWRIDMHARRR